VLPFKSAAFNAAFNGFIARNLRDFTSEGAVFVIFVASSRDDKALRMLHYSTAAARCNKRTLVASETWFLETCRRRYLPELLPALVPVMNPASCAIPLSLLLSQVRKQQEHLLAPLQRS
jgi:hypothetical protein